MSKNYESAITDWDTIYGGNRVPMKGANNNVNLFAIGATTTNLWGTSSIEQSYNSRKNRSDGVDETSFASMSTNVDLELTYVSNNVYKTSVTKARDLQAYPTITMSAITVALTRTKGNELFYTATLKIKKRVPYGFAMDITVKQNTTVMFSFPGTIFLYKREDASYAYMEASFRIIDVTYDHRIEISRTYTTHPIHNPVTYNVLHVKNTTKKVGHIRDYGECLYPGKANDGLVKWDIFTVYNGSGTSITSAIVTSVDTDICVPSIVDSSDLDLTGGILTFNLNLFPNVTDIERVAVVDVDITLNNGDIISSTLSYLQDHINNLYAEFIPPRYVYKQLSDIYHINKFTVNSNNKAYYRQKYRVRSGSTWNPWIGGLSTGDTVYEASGGTLIPHGFDVSEGTVDYIANIYIPVDAAGVADNAVKVDADEFGQFSSYTTVLTGGSSINGATSTVSMDYDSNAAWLGITYSSGMMVYTWWNDEKNNVSLTEDYTGSGGVSFIVPIPRKLYSSTADITFNYRVLSPYSEYTPALITAGESILGPPATPTNLDGRFVNAALKFWWAEVTADIGAVTYDLQWGVSSGNLDKSANGVTTNSYTTTSALAANVYFRVRTHIGSTGVGEWSSQSQIIWSVPSAPANLVMGGGCNCANNNVDVTFSWDAVSYPILRYELWKQLYQSASYKEKDVTGTSTSTTVIYAGADTDPYKIIWRVYAILTDGSKSDAATKEAIPPTQNYCDSVVCAGNDEMSVYSSSSILAGNNPEWITIIIDPNEFIGSQARVYFKSKQAIGSDLGDLQVDNITMDRISWDPGATTGFMEVPVIADNAQLENLAYYDVVNWVNMYDVAAPADSSWKIGQGETPTPNTGNNTGATGGSYFYTEVSGSTQYDNRVFWMRTQVITVEGELSFQLAQNGADCGDMEIMVIVEN